MTDFYVDSSATGADNGNTPADAWNSLVSIVGTAAGDRVWIRRTHNETWSTVVTLSGVTSSNPVHFVGWPISGDVYYPARPAAGVTAGWDTDSDSALPTLSCFVSAPTLCSVKDAASLYRFRFFVSGAGVVISYTIMDENAGKNSFEDITVELAAGAVISIYALFFNNAYYTNLKNITLKSVVGSTFRWAIYGNYFANVENIDASQAFGGGSSPTVLTAAKNIYRINGLQMPSTNQGWYSAFTSNSNQSSVHIRNLSVDACSGYGITLRGGARLENCDFGVNAVNTYSDLNVQNGLVYCRGCVFNSPVEVYQYYIYSPQAVISCEHDKVVGAWKSYHISGQIEKVSSPVRSGGANHSYLVTPTAAPIANLDLALGQAVLESLAVIGATATAMTVVIYVRTDNYTTLPTADELYLECSYLSSGADASRTTIASTNALAVNGVWTALSVTFTPQQDGLAFLRVVCNSFEPGSPVRTITIDPQPVVS